jgi:glycosyltransferase involved in cell wall biosynthesis
VVEGDVVLSYIIKQLQPDISIVILSRNEGRHGHQTMRSILLALDKIDTSNKLFELLVIHGKSDSLTREVYGHFVDKDVRQVFLEESDELALFRSGVGESKGNNIVFVPGGHILGFQWFESICSDSLSDVPCFYVPEYEICFGADSAVTRFLSSHDKCFDLGCLMDGLYWNTGHFFVQRLLLSKLLEGQVISEDIRENTGFWCLFCEALAQGNTVSVLAGTAVFTRKPWNGRLPVHFGCDITSMKCSLFDCGSFRAPKLPATSTKETSPLEKEIDSLEGNRKSPWGTSKVACGVKNFFCRQTDAPSIPDTTCNHSEQNFLPEWMQLEILEMNSLEPIIVSDSSRSIAQRCEGSETSLSVAYEHLCSLCGEDIEYVFLVPWLITGGADLETINMVHALERQGHGKKIAIIATENVESSWRSKLPANVYFIAFGQTFHGLSIETQDVLLNRFILQIQPSVIHNINSLHGYRLFIHKGSALQKSSRLFVSVFCFDFLKNGSKSGFAVHCLPDCFDFLEAVSSDNQFFLDELHQMYGYEKSKLAVLYQPCMPARETRLCNDGDLKKPGTLQVLWAGRMDRQKRPDVLLAIAKQCSGLPIHFHVYGAAVLDEEQFISKLEAVENVTCYGSYDGFSSLPVHLFDAYLYTSQWDGLPNVLLDAAVSGLPVIASDVGGIHEFIEHEKNGFLVKPFDDSAAYVSLLKKLLVEEHLLRKIQKQMDSTLKTRFSWERFSNSLNNIYNVMGSTN